MDQRFPRAAALFAYVKGFYLREAWKGVDFYMALNMLKSFFLRGRSPSERHEVKRAVFENMGFCPICQHEVRFAADNDWYRDSYICTSCGSVPRERALMCVIDEYFPDWKNLVIHESSPIGRGTSERLRTGCASYVPSQLFPDAALGSDVEGVRCENFEALTFADNSIDLHVSQDVMEHVFSPAMAFREIARTLKPGGAHIFTVPIVNKQKATQIRARLNKSGEVVHVEEPQYHGNPIDDRGSLVTVDWGYDICRHIFEASGLFTHVIRIDDLSRGIRAEYVDVLVTVKPAVMAVEDGIP